MTTEQTKTCRVCKQDLALVCFQRDRTRPDKLNQRCRNCQAVWQATYGPLWYQAHRDAHRSKMRAYKAQRKAFP